MKKKTKERTVAFSDEQRKALKKAANAYIKKIKSAQDDIYRTASGLPGRITEAGGHTSEAEFLCKKIEDYAKTFDANIAFIRERYIDCTHLASDDYRWRWASAWDANTTATDELLATELRVNALLLSCGLEPMKEYYFFGHILSGKLSESADDKRRALCMVANGIWKDLFESNEPTATAAQDENAEYPLPEAVRELTDIIRESYTTPAAAMLADSIEDDCTHTCAENLGVYFAGVRMYVNNEYAFAENAPAFEKLDARLMDLAADDYRNSTAGGFLQHTIYTSSLLRYAILNLKAALLNPVYGENNFDHLRSLLSKVSAELNKDNRGYFSLASATFDMSDDGIPYINAHDPAGEMEELLKVLQAVSVEHPLFGQYYNFIYCCISAHDNVEGNEW